MQTYLYLSTIPEALIASMLGPAEFGAYLATGTRKRSHGEAMFFEVRPGFTSDYFDLSRIARDCVAHTDGRPKHSVYLGVYRVLEHVPLSAIGKLHLVTKDGRVLALDQAPVPTAFEGAYHLYDEFCPVHPLVASKLDPPSFCHFVTDPARPVHVPRICFAELDVPELDSLTPESQIAVREAPPYLKHVYDCIHDVEQGRKETKTVDRTHQTGGWGRLLKNGFFTGDQHGLLFFPFPSLEELEAKHHDWWRSASL